MGGVCPPPLCLTDEVHIQTTTLTVPLFDQHLIVKGWSRCLRGSELGQTHCLPPLELQNKNTWGKTLVSGFCMRHSKESTQFLELCRHSFLIHRYRKYISTEFGYTISSQVGREYAGRKGDRGHRGHKFFSCFWSYPFKDWFHWHHFLKLVAQPAPMSLASHLALSPASGAC